MSTLAIVLVAVALLVTLTASLAAPLTPVTARADGDPASDVLLGQNVFYPYNPPVSSSVQTTLNDETTAAGKAHFPIKVALIGSPTDLGIIPELFGKPQKYANFLDQEISFQGPQPLLVVMATGYGVQGMGPSAASTAAVLAKPVTGQPNDLARAAITAVAKLASATGHPLAGVPGASSAGGSDGSTTLIVVLLVVAALATAAALIAVRRRQAGASLRPRQARR